MKKISAVLLVMVLVGSVVFAGFSGSVSTSLGANFEEETYGFKNNAEELTVDLNFVELMGEAKGEGDIYADIAASFTMGYSTGSDDSAADGDYDSTVLVDFVFDHATIVGPNWSVGITETADAADWAVSAIDDDDRANDATDYLTSGIGVALADADAVTGADTYEFDSLSATVDNLTSYANADDTINYSMDVNTLLGSASGVEVNYAGYLVSVGLDGSYGSIVAADDYFNMYGALATPDIALADGLTAAVAVAGSSNKSATTGSTDSTAAWSVKANYADDMITAAVASDMAYDDDTFYADVALSAAYDMVAVDAYFATDVMVDGEWTADDASAYPTDYLSAQAVVDLAPLTVTLSGSDLLDTIDLGVELGYVVSEGFAVAGNFDYNIDAEDWDFGVGATYATDMYVAAASVDYFYHKLTDDFTKAINVSVGSATIIPGAVIGIAYEYDDDDADDGDLPTTTVDNRLLIEISMSF